MKGLLSAAVLLLLLVICSIDVEAYNCKCIRKRPKISYKDVQKVEVKARYPFCKEKMIYVTTSRSRRQQYCLHPKLPSTRNLINHYIKWMTTHAFQVSAVFQEVSSLAIVAWK
ncbi:C-X-C motif chemokine 14 isoform X1 [Mobula hypostoma]|uniref:C-X-C motif chemokine 14 isoform X1 n=1 Tax=Mobula hypostoma TaxID=723540 RepID=UPI002FC3D522